MQVTDVSLTDEMIDVRMPVHGQQDAICRCIQDNLDVIGIIDGPWTSQRLMT